MQYTLLRLIVLARDALCVIGNSSSSAVQGHQLAEQERDVDRNGYKLYTHYELRRAVAARYGHPIRCLPHDWPALPLTSAYSTGKYSSFAR